MHRVLFERPLNEDAYVAAHEFDQQLSINLPIADHAGALHFP